MPRRRLTLLALAILVAGLAVTTIGAAAAPRGDAPTAAHVVDATAPVAPPAVDAGGSTAAQTVSVGVRAGDLSVAPADATIVLNRDASTGAYRGVLPRVTVTDARGSLAGWTVHARLELADGTAAVDVVPAAPVVIAGFADGIAAGPTTHAVGSTDAVLVTASNGEGGGTFASPGALVTVRSAHPDGATLTAHVSFAVR